MASERHQFECSREFFKRDLIGVRLRRVDPRVTEQPLERAEVLPTLAEEAVGEAVLQLMRRVGGRLPGDTRAERVARAVDRSTAASDQSTASRALAARHMFPLEYETLVSRFDFGTPGHTLDVRGNRG